MKKTFKLEATENDKQLLIEVDNGGFSDIEILGVLSFIHDDVVKHFRDEMPPAEIKRTPDEEPESAYEGPF